MLVVVRCELGRRLIEGYAVMVGPAEVDEAMKASMAMLRVLGCVMVVRHKGMRLNHEKAQDH